MKGYYCVHGSLKERELGMACHRTNKMVAALLVLAVVSSCRAMASTGPPETLHHSPLSPYDQVNLANPRNQDGITQREQGENQWIPVPQWLAGTWQARFQTFLDSYDCRSGRHSFEEPSTLQIARQRVIGAQQDEHGQIWHYGATPYVRNTETETYVESQTIEQLSLLSCDQNQVKIRTVGTVRRWCKTTRRLLDTFYERTVITYSPLNDGIIKADYTVTDFDTDGQPLHYSHSVCVERRIKPFMAVDHDERGNLKERFQQFIAARSSAPHLR
ncbi:MAG TPA: hypothetical protein V6D17_11130 [Candidatus Obscuribacterales bacterium]